MRAFPRRMILCAAACLWSGVAHAQVNATPPPPATVAGGGTVHGSIRSGTVPLPGVEVTATNTLTGKKYSAATDARGQYMMTIPANGRYVIRTDFPAFASLTHEVLFNGSVHEQTADFTLELASRAQQQEQRSSGFSGRGVQNLSLLGAAADLIQAGAGGEGGATLPTAANGDLSGESVAVTGQSGTQSPFASLDMDQLRRNAQNAELNESLSGTPGSGPGQGGPGAGGFGGRGGGGFGGGGGGFRGGRGGGFGNFRNFRPDRPHGAFFWNGGNGALNATDFPLRGQPIVQPAYAQNRFGLTFLGEPYIPGILTHDNKDFLFFTASENRSSSPYDQYGTVPTASERAGNFSGLVTPSGAPVTIYNPATGQPYPNNTITTGLSPAAQAILQYVPLPNLTGQSENYQRLTTSGTNTTQVGARFIHNFGSAGRGGPMMGMIRQYLGQGGPGIRQNLSLNYNYAHTGTDELNLFPALSGRDETHQNSLQLGYTLGRGRLTNIFNLGWNRTNTSVTNEFTNRTDIASQLGLGGLPQDPRLYGLPDVTLNQFSSIEEQQPNQELQETLSLSESSSWNHKKHNLRWGGDFRRVYLDDIGYLGGQVSDVTGTYIFSGVFTEQPGATAANGGVGTTTASGTPTTGSSLADFLLGMPQQTSLQAPNQETHLRENAWDAFAQDDYRALRNLTLLFGLRYEYYSPYSERNDRLATLDTGNDFASVAPVVANGIGPFTGKYPRGLIYPEHNNFSPRLGFAWSAHRGTVIRGGYGINYAVGQYGKFVQDLAFQPPFADVQTNEFTTGSSANLVNGFPAPQADGNWAIDKNYRLPYVQVWNLNIQRTIPWNVVVNVGYSGSKGTRLDIVDAPGRTATASESGVLYDYEQATGFSNYNGLTISARKRMSNGLSLQGRYTYSHSIDDASSIGATGLMVAQNWQDLLAEESNSSFDIRHQFVGNFVYELPFGPDTHLLTTGWVSKAVESVSISGTYDLATGEPLTPHYEATAADVARGTTSSLRPDRVAGVSITRGGGSIYDWFNKDAFTAPANVYGTASRYSIPGPGTVTADMSLSKTVRFGQTRTFEVRATADNVFNTVQYSGVDTTVGSQTYGYVTGVAAMRQFTFLARFRY